jgi:hypothetical protein
MFGFKTQEDPVELTVAIRESLDELRAHNADSEEYAKIMSQLERLYALKIPEKDKKRVSPDTVLAVVGNLAGIVMILNYERVHVVASKALGFVLKAKV